jgi:hypothetical protein
MVKRSTRTQACGSAEACRRLDHARSFLKVAELTADVNDLSLEYASVAASVAILAGAPVSDRAAGAIVLGVLGIEVNDEDASVENDQDGESSIRLLILRNVTLVLPLILFISHPFISV